MNVNEFITERISELNTFAINMTNLDIKECTQERWMELYLDWTEWTTDMHDMCWKQDQ